MPWSWKRQKRALKPIKTPPLAETLENNPLDHAIRGLRHTATERELAFPRFLAPVAKLTYAKPMRQAVARVGMAVTNALKADLSLRKRAGTNRFVFVHMASRRLVFTNARKHPGKEWVRLDMEKVRDGTYARETMFQTRARAA